MFEDSLLDHGGRGKTKSPVTVAVSFLLQTIVVGIMILIPLIYTEALPSRQMITFLMAPPQPPPPPPPPTETPKVQIMPKQIRQPQEMVQPNVIPRRVALIQEDPIPPGPMVGIVPGAVGVPGQSGGSILGSEIGDVAPPPLPPPPPERIPVGGAVAEAKLISQPRPVYPLLARQARIQGTVRLKAFISKDGTIENLTVLSGHPLLIEAAVEAVKLWRYQPTLLNGLPVGVVTNVDVKFTLGG